MPSVILIAGQKRSGKDTLGKFLKDSFHKQGKSVELMSFADPMKDILAITLGLSRGTLDTLKDIPELPYRGYLQRLGTEAIKPLFGENVWVELAQKAVDDSTADVVIFTDFRFPSEGVLSITTIKVVNPSLKEDLADLHISERALESFEFNTTINNNATLEVLAATADSYVLNYKG